MRRFVSILFGLVVVGICVVGGWFGLTDDTRPSSPKTVVIAPGSNFAEAAERLDRADIVWAPLLRVYAKLTGEEGGIQAGSFIFPAHETVAEVLDHLTVHPLRANVWVTIPEGYTAAQIEQALSDVHLVGARGFAYYAHHTSTSLGHSQTRTLEGCLYPDTYLINYDARTADIAQMMVAEFRQHLPSDAEKTAHRLGYTLPQIVTVASLIEREAQSEAERPLMAGVYYRRLRIGMPLQVDASLEYLLAHHESALRFADLKQNSQYNTYLHRGLPPTPIANPGLPAINAALHPLRTRYLYYVYKGGGRHAFAETYQDHKANIARYSR